VVVVVAITMVVVAVLVEFLIKQVALLLVQLLIQ
jgi:hypothetical protein